MCFYISRLLEKQSKLGMVAHDFVACVPSIWDARQENQQIKVILAM